MPRRLGQSAIEAGFDVCAWITGLLFAAELAQAVPAGGAVLTALGPLALSAVIPVAGCGLAAGLYRHRYQRGSLDEMLAVLTAALATALCLGLAVEFVLPQDNVPAVLVLGGGAAMATLIMLGGRYAVVAVRLRARAASTSATSIVVFGAGQAGEQLIRRLVTEQGAEYRPVAILDDDPGKRQLLIHGVPVRGDRHQMAEVAARTGARVLVIALAGTDGSVLRELVGLAEQHGLRAKVIPSLRELLQGSARIESVRDPMISDLLGRRPIKTDLESIASRFAGRRVLVTGAGGSIGSELCRQLNSLNPARLIMLDRDESALHALELDLHGHGLLTSDDIVVADIRDGARMKEVFHACRPQIVFHAAALKHLTLLERHPGEALLTNVFGTLAVLEAAAATGVEAFVNISTDKAANAISVLGHTKRIAERLTAFMAEQTSAPYLSVRFGNVLGSRGSVLSSLSAQIAAGGPVTVTHPDVTRYFMTADEAVQLVLHAAVIGRGGEVLVLDMGEPVRIADIARRLGAGGDGIEIVFTGLRPGEKLAEHLLGAGESDSRPAHPLISQVPVPSLCPSALGVLDRDSGAQAVRDGLARLACARPASFSAGQPVPQQNPASRLVRPSSNTAVLP
jgi:FlaA1/EpsC-like NDP-sugar epimerase